MNLPHPFGGLLRSLDGAPRGFFIETKAGFYKGPFMTEQQARDELGPGRLGKDGSVRTPGGHILFWRGKPG